ncbi:hypothetical protein GCM10008967_02240 [Bacillus carboniphilus]|uniref:Uncharacterized protein n=1 Tax=Bacillus carboniphilus TaxID=86663 RepID=A0ABN0VR73_9BACI
MDLRELIQKINKCSDELDLVSARVYLEENLNLLKERQSALNSNARELLKFLLDRVDAGVKPLSRQEMATIHTINIRAKDFDLRGIKLCIKNHTALLLRKDVLDYLSADAKIILEGMGAISKKEE